MSIARHHQEWMGLLDHSGPFLSHTIVAERFRQGLSSLDSALWSDCKLAYEQWRDGILSERPDLNLHRAWISYVLIEALGLESVIVNESKLPDFFQVRHHQTGVLIKPGYAVCQNIESPKPAECRLLVMATAPNAGLEKQSSETGLSAISQMIYLQHALKVPLGIVTNGEEWTLVFAVPGETTGLTTWYASLWTEEKITLRSFRELLNPGMLVGAAAGDSTADLYEKSRDDQVEVTRQLGDQVRRAVEILIHAIDKINRDREGNLLAGFDEKRLYDAALTFMMRLVFLACAEERRILLPELEEFQANYGLFSLYEQLINSAAKDGEEVLERRGDAYVRLLATFRAIHGGIQHADFHLPAYGGSLFDPDRFPFLEGRQPNETLHQASPLQINNRTVLHLLQSLLFLQLRVGGQTEARRISFRALSVEQIGHVYEGLLDHTARRAEETLLSLQVNQKKEPVVKLAELEAATAKGEAQLVALLHEKTGKTENQIRKALQSAADANQRLLTIACDHRKELVKRIQPYANLLQSDSFGIPLVMEEGSVYVGEGDDRRSTGTHYTPRSLTGPIVEHTLEPLVYTGPAEGLPAEEWKLKRPEEILALNVCDPAMGSGAFLVQSCRYLADRLLASWKKYGPAKQGKAASIPLGIAAEGHAGEEFLASSEEEQRIQAMRVVVERCLFGVDVNPMAVEMAKLSLWLETMQRNRPFSFLDHALKCGDSLLGIDREYLEQLVTDDSGQAQLTDNRLIRALAEAAEKRAELELLDDTDISVIHKKEQLLADANRLSAELEKVALYITGGLLAGVSHDRLRQRGPALLNDAKGAEFEAYYNAAKDGNALIWFAEFPEIFNQQGFDAIVGNPPFMGGQKITGNFTETYREYLVNHLAKGKRGSADLCSYFFIRSYTLLKDKGSFGLLATNTIAQGDTREVGLDQILDWGGAIYRANPTRPWPGEAGVHVAAVWFHKGEWSAGAILENEKLQETKVSGLTAYLTEPGTVVGNPYKLKANEGLSFQGSVVLGMGFVLEPAEAEALIQKNKKNADVIKPYLNGEDLNSRPDQSASRFVINFYDWPLERTAAGSWYEGWQNAPKEKQTEPGFTFYEDPKAIPADLKAKRKKWLQKGRVPADYPYPVARDYPACIKIVEERVKPERDKNNRAVYREKWWHFAEKRPALYKAIRGMDRVVVKARYSPSLSFQRYNTKITFSENLVLFPISGVDKYAIMRSIFHEVWAWQYGSTLGSAGLRYSPSDCFDTFPFPSELSESISSDLVRISLEISEIATEFITRENSGLSDLYNAFNNQTCDDNGMVSLRNAYQKLDKCVKEAYGFSDIDISRSFYEFKGGSRFIIHPKEREKLLNALLRLNHEKYEAEVQNERKLEKKAVKKSKNDDSQGVLL